MRHGSKKNQALTLNVVTLKPPCYTNGGECYQTESLKQVKYFLNPCYQHNIHASKSQKFVVVL